MVAGLIVTPAAAAEPARQVFALQDDWTPASLAALEAHAAQIDVLMPDWLGLSDGKGSFTEVESMGSAEALSTLQRFGGRSLLAPIVSDFSESGTNARAMQQVISTRTGRRRLIDNLAHYLARENFDGVTVRFEGLNAGLAAPYLAFARELHAALSPLNLKIYHALEIEDDPRWFAGLAEVADAIVVIGDGEDEERAGPIAPFQWYRRTLGAWTVAIPAQKLVFPVFGHARDWTGENVATVPVLEAMARAREAQALPLFDPQTGNTSFSYADPSGRSHTVWMSDAVGGYNQLKALETTPLKGVGLQHLGLEEPALWRLLDGPLDPQNLRSIRTDGFMRHRGRGQAVAVTATPAQGERAVRINSRSGLVSMAEITSFPTSYEISHLGGTDEKVVALTFDDGPDPQFTPKILAILNRYGIKASFFALGTNMFEHPDLISDIVAQGHDVGSHTFSHVRISAVSSAMLQFELNSTQSIFASITGRNMGLFRAPYAADTTPRTAGEIGALKALSDLGYLVVNEDIDPRDWSKPDADRIADTAIDEASAGLGHVILLHDGGGDRTATVSALPVIIETLQERGFRFVPVSQLIGRDRAAVMPEVDEKRGAYLGFEAAGLAVLRHGQDLLALLFFVAVVMGVARALLLLVLAALPRQRRHQPSRRMRIGVVIPAFNERTVIVKTVRSVLRSRHHDITVVVVDDGSTDGTLDACQDVFGKEERVTLVRQANAGKAAALNHGFELIKTDIVIALDADTVFLPSTISHLVAPFADPGVAAVAGNAKVGNRDGVLTKWQALEYITAQNLDRRAFERLNAISVVPGAVGAWRRNAVLAAGGFGSETLAEDADLTLRLIRNGGRVVYAPDAIALTEAPQSVGQFIKQRFRWMFGTLQVAFKHLDAVRLRDSRSVGLIAIPNIIVFQLLFPLVAPIADLVALFVVADIAFKLLSHAALSDLADPLLFLAFFLMFVLLDALAAVSAFLHERGEDRKLLLWLLPQRFFYRQLLYIVAIRATLAAIRGSMVGWGSLMRSASVDEAQIGQS